MKIINTLFISLIFSFGILFNVYSTQEVEDPAKELVYVRYFLSNSKVSDLFIDLVKKNYKWSEEYILFGNLYENKYFNGQIQFVFLNDKNYKSIIIDFIEYKLNKKIEIKNIYISDNAGGGYNSK